MNATSIRLQSASSGAGFNAVLPSHQAGGYKLGKLSSSTGVVAFNYLGNNHAEAFSVTEKPSNWSNQALLESFVAPTSDTDYRVITADGQTYYAYSDRNITWISDGIWYQLQAKTSLSDQQLVDLAQTL
jgi:hypothetical protein